jgi:hypothetical protein
MTKTWFEELREDGENSASPRDVLRVILARRPPGEAELAVRLKARSEA